MALKPIFKSKPPVEGKTAKKFSFELSLAGLVSGLIITAITLGWIFALGVIVGRGYDPAETLPELAQLLPTDPKEVTPILQDTDLTFMQDLKDKPATGKTTTSAEPKTPAPGVNSPNTGTTSATPSSGANSGAGAGLGSAQTAVPTKVAAPEKVKPEVFNYLIQAVAYKNKDQADRLRERLEGEGLRSRIVIEKDKNGKPRWWRVQIMYRGSETGLEETRSILSRLGIKDTTIASKVPVSKSKPPAKR